MSGQAPAGSRTEWPLEQRGRNSGAVQLCDLDPAAGMLTLDCEPCGRHGRYRLKTLVEVYGPRAGLPDIRHVLVSKGECRGSINPPQPCHALFKGLHDARRPDPSCRDMFRVQDLEKCPGASI